MDERTVAGHLWEYAEQHERFQRAAVQLARYLRELLGAAGIDVFAVEARAKSLTSYRTKSEKRGPDGLVKYQNPARQIEDCIAARIIVFTKQARSRAVALLDQVSTVAQPGAVNPGDSKHNGYDSDHLIITEFDEEDLIRRAPDLHWFIGVRPGLEIQVRTVAGHAWAEYEHDVRYKSPADDGQDGVSSGYDALPASEKSLIDQLFIEAGGLRKYLDQTFDHIERVLRPEAPLAPSELEMQPDDDLVAGDALAGTVLDDDSLGEYLEHRYVGHEVGTERARRSVLDDVQGLGLTTVDALDAALQDVDTKRVASLMPYDVQPTAVRRLEDDLLARFGARMVQAPGELQDDRRMLLEGRLRRLQGKLLIYTVVGAAELEGQFMTAARTFRKLVELVAERRGVMAATIPGLVSVDDDLDAGARAKQLRTAERSVWVNTNLSRSAAEEGMRVLLERLDEPGVRVLRAGDDIDTPE